MYIVRSNRVTFKWVKKMSNNIAFGHAEEFEIIIVEQTSDLQ